MENVFEPNDHTDILPQSAVVTHWVPLSTWSVWNPICQPPGIEEKQAPTTARAGVMRGEHICLVNLPEKSCPFGVASESCSSQKESVKAAVGRPKFFPLQVTQKSISWSWKIGGYVFSCVHSPENKNRVLTSVSSYQYTLIYRPACSPLFQLSKPWSQGQLCLLVIVSVWIIVTDLLAVGTSYLSLWKGVENNSSHATKPYPGLCRDLSLWLICLKVWFQGTRNNWICLITKCSFGTKSIKI